ncbi:hypothetical protein T31B1_04190 [Salinisphaera sp. T31B1]
MLLRVLPWCLLLYIALVVHAIVQSSHWPFALSADARLVELTLDASSLTQWDISKATLCRHDLLPEDTSIYEKIDDIAVIRRRCGTPRRWHAYRPASENGAAAELTARIGGNGQPRSHGATVRLSTLADGRLLVRIAPFSTQPADGVAIQTAGQTPLTLNGDVVLVWPTAQTQNMSLIFPYTAALRIGQDVTTSRHELLEAGHIAVYSASDDTAGGRSVVDSIELLEGDSVQIASSLGETEAEALPRGFVRITAEQMASTWPQMKVVAFGLSNQVRIERYGDAGLDFQPSMWARLTHDSWVVIATLVLFGSLSALATLAEAVRLIRRTNLRP